MPRPRVTFVRNGTTSSGPSGPPKETRSSACFTPTSCRYRPAMPSQTSPVALVTGSSSGIGAEIARRLGTDGYHVVVNSRSSVDSGKAIAAEISGPSLRADVADETQARGLVDEVLSQHGRLDVLINNAGTTQVIPH